MSWPSQWPTQCWPQQKGFLLVDAVGWVCAAAAEWAIHGLQLLGMIPWLFLLASVPMSQTMHTKKNVTKNTENATLLTRETVGSV